MSVGRKSASLGPVELMVAGSGELRVASFTGWDDGATVRSQMEERAGQDGAWDSAGHFGPRVVGIDGFVHSGSHATAHAVLDALSALHPGSVHELAVDDSAIGARSALTRVTQAVVAEWVNDVSFRYSLQVTAPDQVKYGPPLFASTGLSAAAGGAGLVYPVTYPIDYGIPPGVTPGAITLANSGTATYWPRLRIDGPVTNPVVTLAETGDWIRVARTVDAGQWLDIDLAERRVLLNGQISVMNQVTYSGKWLGVPVGGGSLSWTADTADPAALLQVWSYESAWS